MATTFFIIFVISLILAIRSMKDFDVPEAIKKFVLRHRARGTILFMKKKIVHYSSGSSSFSSGSKPK